MLKALTVQELLHRTTSWNIMCADAPAAGGVSVALTAGGVRSVHFDGGPKPFPRRWKLTEQPDGTYSCMLAPGRVYTVHPSINPDGIIELRFLMGDNDFTIRLAETI